MCATVLVFYINTIIMKTLGLFAASALLLVAAACNNDKKVAGATDSGAVEIAEVSPGETRVVAGNYTNLETGEDVYIIPDPETGYAIDSTTRIPVTFYLNTEGDTLTNLGEPAIGLRKDDAGKWKIGDDVKIKVDDDGSIKIKDGDAKIKVDENGDVKVKDGKSYKYKTEGAESKEKDGTTKVKKEDGKTKVKPDNR